MLEKLNPILVKLQPLEPLLLIVGILVIVVLLIVAIVRQRRAAQVINVVTANFANLRTKLDESVTRQKSQLEEGLASVRKQLQQVIEGQQRDATDSGDVRRRLEELGNAVRESVYQVQESLSSAGQNDGSRQALGELRARMEELIEELSWTNNWFVDLKALENAVVNLVGPAKMRKLIDKERSISQAAGEEFIKKSGL